MKIIIRRATHGAKPTVRDRPLCVADEPDGQLKKKARFEAPRWMARYLATSCSPIGMTISHPTLRSLVSLSNQFHSAHQMIRLAATAHGEGGAQSSSILWFVLPMLAMCAVRISLPEALFSSDIRALLGGMLSQHHFIGDLTIQPMRRRPCSRHVFSYKLTVTDRRNGKHSVVELVGKQDTTRAVGKAAKEFEAMRLLWEVGFGQDNRFRIPQPLHHFEDLRLIIQEKARGTKLRTFLGEGTDTSLDHARMSGLWLAKLHNMPVPSPRVCAYEDEENSLRMYVEAIEKDQPKLKSELRKIVSVVKREFESFQCAQASLVHGDFHPDHIYVANNFVTVIDFERFCIGDPARDLGSFACHMRTTAGCLGKPIKTVDQEIAAFLESYFSGVPEAERKALRPRVGPYTALSSLEALYYVASVLKVRNAARIAMYVQCLRESCADLFEAAPSSAGAQAASAQQSRRLIGDNA
jgi:tRNA A-37 threonylcarbamoyl transferase component Bud32